MQGIYRKKSRRVEAKAANKMNRTDMTHRPHQLR